MSEESYCTDCRRETVVVLDRASGDAVCTECGLVLESHFIDETAEWRNFADDKDDHDPNRVGAPVDPLLADAALSTVVSNGPISGLTGGERHGYHAVVSDGHKISGLSWRLNRRNDPYQAIVSAFTTIAEMADRLSLLATIKDGACHIYKKLYDQKSTRGKKVETLAAACIFIACRQEGISRTIKEICSVLNGATKREFTRAVDFIRKHLKEEMGESVNKVTANTGDYLRRFCCKLGMSNEDIRTVRKTIQKSEELDIRRSPISIAAAVIFMINQLSGSKKSLRDAFFTLYLKGIGIHNVEIADATTVAEGTIKNAFRDLQPYAQGILPESYVKGRDLKNIGCLKA
ncbi:hypothetical protein Pfo_028264 [Paulownia fortunei]|nr:hypothetical protein Pfo_028264 [Paulownia fortunei]